MIELEQYLSIAKAAGMPADQIARFKDMSYVALPWACEFHAAARAADKHEGPMWILGGGARGGGKSHLVLAQSADDSLRVPGLKGLYLRKLKYRAAESMEDLAKKVLFNVEVEIGRRRLDYANGSRMLIGGYNHPGDVDKYLGIEYDYIIVEELTQLPQETIRKIRGSLRSTKPGWRVRVYGSTNPGGIGHSFVKQNFVVPWRKGQENILFGGSTVFIPSTYKDNPVLVKEDPEYVSYLESLEGTLGLTWREGNWDVYEGMAFPNWNYEHHILSADEQFEIPSFWPRWRAVDWGFNAPFCCLWFVKDPDIGRIYVVDEVYQRQMLDKQQAELIVARSDPSWKSVKTYADPGSYWVRKSRDDEVYTSADQYRKYGVPLTKADNDRLQGYRKFNQLLGNLPDGRPGIVFWEGKCDNSIRTIPDLPLDPNNLEDVDTDGEDHAYDTARYGLTNVDAHKEKSTEEKNEQSNIEILAEYGRII